jgi:hypothetical protein
MEAMDEEFVAVNDDEEDDDDEDESEDEEEEEEEHDGVLDGGVAAEVVEPGKPRRSASQADIVRIFVFEIEEMEDWCIGPFNVCTHFFTDNQKIYLFACFHVPRCCF